MIDNQQYKEFNIFYNSLLPDNILVRTSVSNNSRLILKFSTNL